MGGFFGTISKRECATDLFYGTDYNSHLGTRRGGLATYDSQKGFLRGIHSLENGYFRSRFEDELGKFTGNAGIGIISDTDAQPMLVNSHLGRFALVTVARVNNAEDLAKKFLAEGMYLTEFSSGKINITELVSLLIVEGAMAVSSESTAFANLGYEPHSFLGPGEIVRLTADGIEQLRAPNPRKQVCSFLWIYYGFPTSCYDGKNVEESRFLCGKEMGQKEDIEVDCACGVPDSGIGMAVGYAAGRGVPYMRTIAKYTPTWSRSFMPTNQSTRDLVAKMKLIHNTDMLHGRKVLFCDDSIVRGTQLRDNTRQLHESGAKEVHMRISCPPLVFGCPFLNFSTSKTELELITRRIIEKFEGDSNKNVEKYTDSTTPEYKRMVDDIASQLNLDSLKFNTIETLVKSIGLPREELCLHCFDGSSAFTLEEENK